MAALADFHFLRPAWLLALLPCALLAYAFLRRRARPALWSELIDPALLAALLLPESGGRRNALPLLLLAGWALAVLGLAGPAWERLPEPVHRASDPLIIALDLGHTMRAGDLAPSRHERARFKLGDILARRQDGQTALIVYAGDAHVVTPLSDDARTLAAMLPALSPDIMPAAGNDLPAAVALAASLARGAGVERGRLLVVTDRFPASQHAEVARALEASGLSLSLLAAGTAAGAPIPLPRGGFLRERDGSIVVPGVDLDTMREGVATAAGRFATLSLDDSDIAALLPPPLATDIAPDDGVTRTFDRWQDRGAWLALALLPLAALAFRRGWLLGIALALLLPQPRAEALEWQDLWLTRDQQGARAMSEQDPARAAQLFRSPDWRATAQYEAGDYAGAAGSWATRDDADAHYNRGNALARAGRLAEALAAYDAALAREPGMGDAAANRKLVEEALNQQRQQQQQQQQQQDQGGQQDANPSQDGQSPADGRQQQSQDGQDSKPGDESGAGGEPKTDAPGTQGAPLDEQRQQQPGAGQRDDKDGKSADATARAEAEAEEEAEAEAEVEAEAGAGAEAGNGEQDQAVEQWLRQVPDDPGALLRRKFEYEYRTRREGA
ncbi:MAG: VWA domain-containing protein, partial [Pseudomonadales bacterium]|nr:VWA domain-containing protein [Pseudomonadales bacterium]